MAIDELKIIMGKHQIEIYSCHLVIQLSTCWYDIYNILYNYQMLVINSRLLSEIWPIYITIVDNVYKKYHR